jgi:hypothetical protein
MWRTPSGAGFPISPRLRYTIALLLRTTTIRFCGNFRAILAAIESFVAIARSAARMLSDSDSYSTGRNMAR